MSIFSHGAEPVEESPDSSPASVANAPAVPEPEPSLPIVSQPQISEIPPAINDISSQTANQSLLPSTLEDVFFDYDQYYIRSEAVPILMQNAEVLLNRHATRTVLIEGHCDERGTEEYNLILGERRAMAVKNYLVDLGVSASSIRILSLGKNEPFCLQPTRECFQKNRRAHFVLK